VVPLANTRPREHGLTALEKRPNGRERTKPLNPPEFVQRLEYRVIKEPVLLILIRRHLPASAPNFLAKRFVSGLQDHRGASLHQIEAIIEVNHGSNDRWSLD
jgi:hypothetical protein